VAATLREAGLRVEVDARTESVGKKIAEAEHLRTPCILVVGDREVESGEVSVRRRGSGNLGAMGVVELRGRLADERDSRALEPVI
jgi:threonyl-tRNA synthetase